MNTVIMFMVYFIYVTTFTFLLYILRNHPTNTVELVKSLLILTSSLMLIYFNRSTKC